MMLFTLQRYEFLSKSQRNAWSIYWQIDVVYLTKVWIFKQITTSCQCFLCRRQMLFTLQRYEFLSKSQHDIDTDDYVTDVVYLTKVWIFKQITTEFPKSFQLHTMLFTLQRYEFLSKSQLYIPIIHILLDVVYLTKVWIFKQITTWCRGGCDAWAMLFTLQRYEFLSKSQQIINEYYRQRRCCLPYKGTNF